MQALEIVHVSVTQKDTFEKTGLVAAGKRITPRTTTVEASADDQRIAAIVQRIIDHARIDAALEPFKTSLQARRPALQLRRRRVLPR